MRGSKARGLRRLAELTTIGKPDRQYVNKPIPGTKTPSPTVVLHNCTRKTYKHLKRVYKSGGMQSVGREVTSGGVPETVQD